MRSIRNCNVAVVGGAGFLGSHLVDHLIDNRNCQVTVIDNLVAGRREFINDRALFVHHDITGSEHYLRQLFVQHAIQYVFNYAAYPYIPDSFARPLHVFDVNAVGAAKVINAAQEAGCVGILQVSSAEIYGEGARTAEGGSKRISEGAPVIPHSTYGAAKAAIDALVQVRWKEAQTPVIALRQFNCCGPRETHPYVIPEIISQIARRIPVSISTDTVPVYLGNNSFRDFQYAGDAVAMATELLECGQFGEVYNMGSENGIKIYDLASCIGSIMNAKIEVRMDSNRVRPWEIWHLQSDNSKLYSVISRRPRVSLIDALRLTVDNFYSNLKWCWEK